MKICYSNPTTLMKRPVALIADRVNKDHECSVFVPRKIGKVRSKKVHYADLDGINVIDYPCLITHWWRSDWPIPCPNFFTKSWKILKENDVVHIWVPFYISSIFLVLLKSLFFRKKKIILTMDTVPAYSFKVDPFWKIMYSIFYRTLGKVFFKNCDAIVMYGDSLKKYAKQAKMPMEKIKIIHTGIDTEVKKKNKNIRKELGLKKNDRIVLFAGIMVHRKGVDTVLRVAEKMKNVKFVLLGDGLNLKKYKAMAPENVIFPGFRKDIHNFLHEADIFFLPSRGEGLAGVIMEAMAYGVPVVSSRIPCTEDLVEHGKTGLLCSVEDVNGYRKSIEKLLRSRKTRETFAKRAKIKVKKEFSWKNSISKLEKLYA